MKRIVDELRRGPRDADAETALARLRGAGDETGVLVVAPDGRGRALAELGEDEADTIRLVAGVYAGVPTRAGRVRLLRQLRDIARVVVSVHVVVGLENSHAGRALVDAPRSLLRRLGVPLAEPGDRFSNAFYTHLFFDEESLLGEIAEAGLALTARRGFTFDLEATEEPLPTEQADSFASEVTRAVRLVRQADRARLEPPAEALAAMRALGERTTRVRGSIGRARLRRAIGWIDALGPGGASCYRRILLESALDAGAARETVVFGLDVGSTGHVAFEGLEDRTFDVAFAIPREPA